MNTKFTEIFRLRDMLDEAKITYVFRNSSFEYPKETGLGSHEHYQIQVYNPRNRDDRIISVIEDSGTYGGYNNLLEIMGCLTPEEVEHDCVKGWLTAEEVFSRIEKELGAIMNERSEKKI